ncbi:hypothetical protein ABW21_db0201422 [Orbilia brochopaga]|nr:hypothetical protein ABW21_db0201422 [Drechslerella brochopaga]
MGETVDAGCSVGRSRRWNVGLGVKTGAESRVGRWVEALWGWYGEPRPSGTERATEPAVFLQAKIAAPFAEWCGTLEIRPAERIVRVHGAPRFGLPLDFSPGGLLSRKDARRQL